MANGRSVEYIVSVIAAALALRKTRAKERQTMKCIQRIALASFLLALALPQIAAAQSGADTYKAKCAMCHGADGSKTTMGSKPLNGPDVQKMSEADLTGVVTNGKGKMPAYKGKLTDAQIKDVVSYIKTLK
jgi:mono/diheme cytochrome c family protein